MTEKKIKKDRWSSCEAEVWRDSETWAVEELTRSRCGGKIQVVVGQNQKKGKKLGKINKSTEGIETHEGSEIRRLCLSKTFWLLRG